MAPREARFDKVETLRSVLQGRTDDLRARLKRHHSGGVRSTQAYKPWRLVYYEAYLNKKDASLREIQLKKHAVKEVLKLQLKYSL